MRTTPVIDWDPSDIGDGGGYLTISDRLVARSVDPTVGEMIVRCVRAHDALVEACKLTLATCGPDPNSELKQAISRAMKLAQPPSKRATAVVLWAGAYDVAHHKDCEDRYGFIADLRARIDHGEYPDDDPQALTALVDRLMFILGGQ